MEGRIEQGILDHAARRIAAGVGEHAGRADPVVEAVVRVAMQPERRPPALDACLEVAHEAGVDRRAREARMNALQRWREMGDDDGRTAMVLRESFVEPGD